MKSNNSVFFICRTALIINICWSAIASAAPQELAGAEPRILEGWGDMPNSIFVDDPSYKHPIFISMGTAFNKSRALDTEFLGPRNLKVLNEISATSQKSNKCVEWRNSLDSDAEAPKSLDVLARSSDNIIVGTVTGTAEGLTEERLGTMIRVDTQEVAKGTPLRATNYVFFPVLDITISGNRTCRTCSLYPRLPAVGDRLIISYNNHWLNDLSEVFGDTSFEDHNSLKRRSFLS